jgi:hypothetical protein
MQKLWTKNQLGDLGQKFPSIQLVRQENEEKKTVRLGIFLCGANATGNNNLNWTNHSYQWLSWSQIFNFSETSAALIVRCNIKFLFFSFPKFPPQPKGGKEYLYATENFILA